MLDKQYAKTYKKEYLNNVKTHGAEKALEIWLEHKAEIIREKVHCIEFMERVVQKMKSN